MQVKKEEDSSSMTKEKAQEEENRLRDLLKKKAEERKNSSSNSNSNSKNTASNNDGKNNNNNGGKSGGATTESSTVATASSATTNSNKRRKGRNRRRRRKRQGRRAAAAAAAAANAPPPMMLDNRYYGQEPPHHPPPYYRRGPPPPHPYGYGRPPPPYMDRGPPDYHRYDGRYHRYNGGGGGYPPPHHPDEYWRYNNNNSNIHPRPPPPDSHRGRRRSISRSISRSRSSSSRSSYSSYSRSSSVSSYSSRSRSNSRSRRRSNSPANHDDDDDDDVSHSSSSTAKGRSKRSRSPSPSSNRKPLSDAKNNNNDDGYNSSRKETKSTTTSSSTSKEDALTKDQRTIFVSQLVMRADERDIRRYFRKKCDSKVNDVILLRDRRTGRHKGCAYVELGRLEDIPKALQVSGVAPDFQRFPILVKASEAEKNYTVKSGDQLSNANNLLMSTSFSTLHNPLAAGSRIESQKVYVGSIDRNVVQAHLQSIFCHFGNLEKVLLQIDTATGLSRGFAFLSFKDPKTSNLAIQTMSGQMLAGRALKTGWASQNSNIPGIQEVTSDEFPADAAKRVHAVHAALSQLNGTGLIATPSLVLIPGMSTLLSGAAVSPTMAGSMTESIMGEPKTQATQIANVADEAINAALGIAPSSIQTISSNTKSISTETRADDPKKVGGADSPTVNILVHNMYDKDEETDDGWEEDIKQEFEEECSKFGKLGKVIVMHKEPGGKIYAVFDTVDGAKSCAESLAGRYFDKRMIRVEFVNDEKIPN